MGARAGLVAPDEKTYAYLKGRPASPDGAAWTARLEQWQLLSSDPQASYDRQIDIDARRVRPMVSWGTNPSQIIAIDETVPDPAALGDAVARAEANRALDYMGLSPGMPIAGLRLDRIFIGSCTNSRIEDLRAAAAIVNGRTVASHVDAMIVPGSGLVKIQAEAEGLDFQPQFREPAGTGRPDAFDESGDGCCQRHRRLYYRS